MRFTHAVSELAKIALFSRVSTQPVSEDLQVRHYQSRDVAAQVGQVQLARRVLAEG